VLPVSTSHIAIGTVVQGHRPTCVKYQTVAMLPTEPKQPNHAVRLEQFVAVQVAETAVLHCVEQERLMLFVCISVPQRFGSTVR